MDSRVDSDVGSNAGSNVDSGLDSDLDSDIGSDTEIQAQTIKNDYQFYEYLDVDSKEIRLLLVYPENKWPNLTCGLETAMLATDNFPEYQCLSYCWGGLEETTTIRLKHYPENLKDELDNYETDKSGQDFHITTNLASALKRLRNPELFILLWVDSICIDQSDVAERSQQVSIMKEIYTSAYRVAIWLGDEDESTMSAFSFIYQVAHEFKKATGVDSRDVVGPDGINVSVEKVREFYNPGDNIEPAWREWFQHNYLVLARLFNRPWFSRVWVLQEVHSATEVGVYCGRHLASWGSLLLTNYWHENVGFQYFDETPYMNGSTTTIETPWKSMPAIWKLITAKGKYRRLPIMDLVLRSREFLATNQRDYVFALLSLAEETSDIKELSPLMRPDYSKTTYQVYTDFTRGLIEMQKSLDILSIVDYRVSSRLELRHSGLPTWSASFNSGPRPDDILIDCQGFNASAGSNAIILESPDTNSICLQGIRVQKIMTIFCGPRPQFPGEPVKGYHDIAADADRAAKLLWDYTGRIESAYATGEDRLLAFIRVLTTNRYPKGDSMVEVPPSDAAKPQDQSDIAWHSPFDQSHLANFAAYWEQMDPGLGELDPRHRDTLLPLVGQGDGSEFRALVHKNIFGRCYFVTSEGYIGLGPSGTHIGDHVAILNGGKVPYVIRTGYIPEEHGGRLQIIFSAFQHDGELPFYCVAPDPFADSLPTDEPGNEPDASRPWFEFLGECYVHGFMKGEAFEAKNCGKYLSYDFELR